MTPRILSERRKQMIAARFATVEPVLGKRRHSKWLDPLDAARARQARWARKRYCMAYNIEKLRHYGYAN